MACCCTELILGLATIVFILYIFVQHKYSYWKKRNVPYIKPKFPLGNCQGISRTRNIGDIVKSCYLESEGTPFAGFYIIFTPGLVIRDPEVAKFILTKEFSSFSGRGFTFNSEIDPLSGHLFFLEGAKWRNVRTKLTPTFTSGKMKMMFPIIEACSEEMTSYLSDKGVVEAGDVFTRYTTNVVTRCAYGIDVDFFKAPDPRLQAMIHRVGNPTFKDAIIRGLIFTLGTFSEYFNLRLVPKELSDYFISLVQETMEERKRSQTERKDFLQLLMELMKKGWLDDPDVNKDDKSEKNNTPFTLNEAAAQAFNFLIGGFDTSAVTMQCCLYELTLHQEIQQKVRDEIREVLSETDNKLTYEALQKMVYLEQVVLESMRLHPIAPFVGRECTKTCKMPNSDLVLEAGTKVWISTSGMQSNPRLFPQPEIFDPERFSPENKSKIHPYSFLPFGEGPRSCIGNRFAIMQMKAGLSKILNEFSVVGCDETPVPPLKRDPKKALLSIVGGIPLRFIKL